MTEHNTPIFVVGVPRSGTTLLAAMLAAHSRLSCGTETRFFHFLVKAEVEQLCCPSTWPARAVDFLWALQLVDIPIPTHFALTRAQLHVYLQSQPPTVPAMLAALTDQLKGREGRARWVEKSPEHLLYVQTIRHHFPTAPLIRIVRDPRDVALSLMKTPWASPHFLDNLMLWRRYDDQSAAFFAQDQRCYTLYYEALVQAPERELRQLCAFLQEEYEPQMLDTSRSAASVVTDKDQWHPIVHKPADRSRSQVWQRELAPGEQRLAAALLGDRLLAYGYPCTEQFKGAATVFPSLQALRQYPTVIEALVTEDRRFWQASDEPQSQASVYVGEPDRDRWLRHEKRARLSDTLRILGEVIQRKLAHQQVFWVHGQGRAQEKNQGENKHSYLGQLLTLFFRLTAERRPV